MADNITVDSDTDNDDISMQEDSDNEMPTDDDIHTMPWHTGEKKMHAQILHIDTVKHEQQNPAAPYLTPGAGYMTSVAPLLALGALDKNRRPWTTIFGGKPGFANPVPRASALSVRARVDRLYDPVIEALAGGKKDGEVIEHEGDGKKGKGKGKMMAGLTIDLETRMRIKLAGRFLVTAVGAAEDRSKDRKAEDPPEGEGELRAIIQINESLGNCPKYLNCKVIAPGPVNPTLVSDSPHLPDQALALLNKADLFFISSSHGKIDMDTNHRGGPVGFIRVMTNKPNEGTVLIYPEYSGNRLYQTLGNLATTPRAGITVPDFDTGDVLYMTGRTEILIGDDAARLLPRSNLAVKYTVEAARFVTQGLPFRGQAGEPSPYNPKVRFTVLERDPLTAGEDAEHKEGKALATLVGREDITPSISRFRFRLSSPKQNKSWKRPTWTPGQYATLSFAEYLDRGYSHMRDDDPKSLNEDYVRTFTVSKAPNQVSPGGEGDEEFEITVRNVGRVTSWLFQHYPPSSSGSPSAQSTKPNRSTKPLQRRKKTGEPLVLPLLGFEGHFHFDVPSLAPKDTNPTPASTTSKITPVIAAGIGITPLLGQLGSMFAAELSSLRLLWAINERDIRLVADTISKYPALASDKEITTLFITADNSNSQLSKEGREEEGKAWKAVNESGLRVHRRRMEKSDVEVVDRMFGADEKKGEWYMCVGPALKTKVLSWVGELGRRVVHEDFYY